MTKATAATAASSLAAKIESLPYGIHGSVIVWCVVKRKVPDLLVWDLVGLEYLDDFVSNIGPKCRTVNSGNPRISLRALPSSSRKKHATAYRDCLFRDLQPSKEMCIKPEAFLIPR